MTHCLEDFFRKIDKHLERELNTYDQIMDSSL